MHLSLKRSLQLLVAIASVGLIFTLSLFIHYSSSSSATISRLINVEGEASFLLHEMWAQGLQTEQALRNIIFNPKDDKAKKNYIDADQAFVQANALALEKSPTSRAALTDIQTKWGTIQTLKRNVQDLAESGKAEEAVAALNTKETPLWREVKASLLDLIAAHKKQFKDAFQVHKEQEERIRTFIIAGTTGFFLLLLVYIQFLTRRIEKPIRVMTDFAQAIATGNFNVQLEGRFAPEFEELKQDLRLMTDELKSSLGFSRSVMKGFVHPFLTVDTEAHITFANQAALDMLDIPGPPEAFVGKTTGEFFYGDAAHETRIEKLMRTNQWSDADDTVLTSRKGRKVQVRATRSHLEDLEGKRIGGICIYLDLTAIKESEQLACTQAGHLRTAAAETGEIAAGLFDSAERLSVQVEQVAKGAKGQRAQTAEAATAMARMNDSVAQVGQSAEMAAAEAAKTEEKALSGAKVVEKSVAVIRRVAEASDELGTNMAKLQEQSESIGRVLVVISDIADQTNLLALNAAIEAARAGEAGRGFAVVADEVRKLAEKTMQATKEVDEKIKAIQDSAKGSMTRMSESMEIIQEATRLAGESGSALSEIVDLARRSADCSKEIVTVSRDQSRTADVITRLSEEVRRIADDTDAGMSHAAEAVEQLTRVAGSLKGLVDRLKC